MGLGCLVGLIVGVGMKGVIVGVGARGWNGVNVGAMFGFSFSSKSVMGMTVGCDELNALLHPLKMKTKMRVSNEIFFMPLF